MYINSSISAISSYGWSNFEKCFSFKTQRFLLVFLRWKVSVSFPSFCFCRNSLLPFILNDSMAVYGILGWESSFSALCVILEPTSFSTVWLLIVLGTWSVTSLTDWKLSLCVCLVSEHFSYDVTGCGSLRIHLFKT